MEYPLTRASTEINRFSRNKDGFLYLFCRFEDRWDVYKFRIEKLREAHEMGLTAEYILERSTPQYRVTALSCTCPGFSYRRDCWHRDQVRES